MSNENDDIDLVLEARKKAKKRAERIVEEIRQEVNERIPENIAKIRREHVIKRVKNFFNNNNVDSEE